VAVAFAGREGRLLLGRGFGLVARLPRLVGHAVDDLTRRVVAQVVAVRLRGRGVPLGQAVPAKAGQVHQVDVLDVGALLQVGDQVAEHLGIEPSTLDTHTARAAEKIEAAETTLDIIEAYERDRYPPVPDVCDECGGGISGAFARSEDYRWRS